MPAPDEGNADEKHFMLLEDQNEEIEFLRWFYARFLQKGVQMVKMDEAVLTGSVRIIGFCPNCGKPIPEQRGSGRRRIFCSDRCRNKYARQHPGRKTRENARELRCEYCGGVFMVYQRTNKQRRFCSVSCARRFTLAQRARAKRSSEKEGK